MQVYALITDGKICIVPKKAEKNNIWHGKKDANLGVVNQAGQYCLFGGKAEKRLTPTESIIKEILEESGENILDYKPQRISQHKKNDYTYTLFIISLEDEQFTQLKYNIQNNITALNAAKNSAESPNNTKLGIKIEDGEMQSIIVASVNELDLYLGNKAPLTDIELPEDAKNNAGRHAIDWYAEIAQLAKQKLTDQAKLVGDILTHTPNSKPSSPLSELDMTDTDSPISAGSPSIESPLSLSDFSRLNITSPIEDIWGEDISRIFISSQVEFSQNNKNTKHSSTQNNFFTPTKGNPNLTRDHFHDQENISPNEINIRNNISHNSDTSNRRKEDIHSPDSSAKRNGLWERNTTITNSTPQKGKSWVRNTTNTPDKLPTSKMR